MGNAGKSGGESTAVTHIIILDSFKGAVFISRVKNTTVKPCPFRKSIPGETAVQ